MKEIQGLPPEERREIWRQLSQLVVETSGSNVSDVEFAVALDELTGCTVQRNATARLLEERQREREREQTQLEARANSHSHA